MPARRRLRGLSFSAFPSDRLSRRWQALRASMSSGCRMWWRAPSFPLSPLAAHLSSPSSRMRSARISFSNSSVRTGTLRGRVRSPSAPSHQRVRLLRRHRRLTRAPRGRSGSSCQRNRTHGCPCCFQCRHPRPSPKCPVSTNSFFAPVPQGRALAASYSLTCLFRRSMTSDGVPFEAIRWQRSPCDLFLVARNAKASFASIAASNDRRRKKRPVASGTTIYLTHSPARAARRDSPSSTCGRGCTGCWVCACPRQVPYRRRGYTRAMLSMTSSNGLRICSRRNATRSPFSNSSSRIFSLSLRSLRKGSSSNDRSSHAM